MTRWLHRITFSIAVLTLAVAVPVAAHAQTPASVQIVAADARVHLSADASSPVVTPVPVGAVLEVLRASGNWYEVRLPKDASGFDRVGFVQKSKVKEMAATGGAGAARPAGGAATTAPSTRPTAAIMDFEFGTVQKWWDGNWDIGKGIADMLVDELLASGQLRLLERKKIEAVLAEQNLSNSNRADPSAAEQATLRKILGARVLITGTVTKFGGEESNVGGAAGVAAGRFLGGAGAKNTTANVAITVRAIDSSTGEVLASVRGEGKSNRRGILLGGRVSGTGGAFNMGSSDFRETILGEATDKAVKDAAAKLSASIANAIR